MVGVWHGTGQKREGMRWGKQDLGLVNRASRSMIILGLETNKASDFDAVGQPAAESRSPLPLSEWRWRCKGSRWRASLPKVASVVDFGLNLSCSDQAFLLDGQPLWAFES